MFFRGLRILLAKDVFSFIRHLDYNDFALGHAVVSVIQTKFIPELQNSQEDSERIRDVIGLWKEYAEAPRIWNSIAANQIRVNMVKYPIFDNEHALDVGQDIAVELFAGDLSAFTYRPEDGPEKFKGWWKKFVAFRTKNYVRKLLPKLKAERGRRDIIDDDGDTVDSLMGIPAPEEETEVDRQSVKAFKGRLRKHLHTKTDEVGILLYDHWVEAVEKHPDRVNVRKEVYEPVMEISGKGRTTLEYHWKKVKGFIVKFLENSEGIRLRKTMKDKLKISEVVAIDRWSSEMSRWVLEPRRCLERSLRADI